MAQVPGFNEYSHEDRAFLLSTAGMRAGKDALLASGQTQAASPGPDHRLYPGSVVVKDTGAGKFYLADDATFGDRNGVAKLTTSGYIVGLGDVIIVGNRGTISVTLTTGTGTATEARDDLNADDAFGDHFVASESGGELTITARETGVDEYFHIDPASADRGWAEGETNAARGDDAEYRVIDEVADLKDLEAADVDYLARTLRAGHFSSALLLNATAEALAVLERRGSHIE